MKCNTEKENKEIIALTTLVDSDNKSIADFAKYVLDNMTTIGVEIVVNGNTAIDVRVMDNDLNIAEYIAIYDEYVAKGIGSTEDYAVKIEAINLLTGEVVFCAEYEIFNKGESTITSEWCSRKALREMI